MSVRQPSCQASVQFPIHAALLVYFESGLQKETTTIRTRGQARAPRKHPRLIFSRRKKVAEFAVTFFRLYLAIDKQSTPNGFPSLHSRFMACVAASWSPGAAALFQSGVTMQERRPDLDQFYSRGNVRSLSKPPLANRSRFAVHRAKPATPVSDTAGHDSSERRDRTDAPSQ